MFWPNLPLVWKCLEHWNGTVCVDEGKNATSANQRLSSTSSRNLKYLKLGVVPDLNCVEDLRMKFVEFINRGIPARHFQARLFLRPFWLPEGSGVQPSFGLPSGSSTNCLSLHVVNFAWPPYYNYDDITCPCTGTSFYIWAGTKNRAGALRSLKRNTRCSRLKYNNSA